MAVKSKRSDRLAALLSKMKSMQLESGGFWKPPIGTSTIRILPPIGDMGDIFFVETGQHYMTVGEGKTAFFCPKITTGEKCPLCEANELLYRAGEKDAAKNFRAGRAFFMNIIDRSNEDTGPQIFTPGVTILQALQGVIADPEYGDISDPEEGYDIKIDRKGEGQETKYTIRPAKNSTPLSKDEEQAEEWMGGARDLAAMITEQLLSYDELVKKGGVGAYLGLDDEDDEEEQPARKPAKAATKPARKPVVEEEEDDEEEDEEEEPVRKPTKVTPKTTSKPVAAGGTIAAKLEERRRLLSGGK